jgi:transcription termination/antitermination protein NusA
MNGELLRLIEGLHREKEIHKEILFQSLETALATAIRKRYGIEEEISLTINRSNGQIECEEFDLKDPRIWAELGRIAAQTAKQVMIQRLREAERDVVYGEYEARAGRIVTGTVQRFEGEAIIVNLGRAEGILPREERVKGELYRPGDRIRCLVLEVKKVGPKVKIILSRGHADLVRRLFEIEVPEINDGIIEVRRIVREPGYRTKFAVWSNDPKIDCVGACVGVRGSRIKSIIDELNGEKIDIIRWNDSLEVLVQNALKPAVINIDNIFPDEATKTVTVIVDEDQQSLAIGKGGRNVRLASRLAGWDIEIKTRAEFETDELARRTGGVPAEALPSSPESSEATPATPEAAEASEGPESVVEESPGAEPAPLEEPGSAQAGSTADEARPVV